MGANVQDVVGQIERIVRDEGGSVSGSRLATVLRANVPGWVPSNHNAGSLREFIRANVPTVTEIARVGMDVLYGFVPSQPAPPLPAVPQTVSHQNFWRIWVSPDSPIVLAIGKDDLSIRASHRGQPTSPNSVVLEPPNAEFHKDIGRQFLGEVAPDLQARLRTIVETGEKVWWKDWLAALDECGQTAHWWVFRRIQFERELTRRLKSSDFPDRSVERIVDRIRPHRNKPACCRPWSAPANVG